MLSQSHGLRAVRSLDPLHTLRSNLGRAAEAQGHWAGIPIPIDDMPLIVEPTYPHAEMLMELGRKKPESGEQGWSFVNSWHCRQRRVNVHIVRDPEGKVHHFWEPGFHHIKYDLGTLGASDVWGIEQEGKAVQLLGQMLRHRQFKQYLMTGMFLEQSKRSRVTYLFRKLKPTVAIAPARPGEDQRSMSILACLCMHPIAYYEGSWAGAMCPTDDVIAHLALMRGDEAMFWKRCNQHPPHRPEAGL